MVCVDVGVGRMNDGSHGDDVVSLHEESLSADPTVALLKLQTRGVFDLYKFKTN